MKRGWVFVIVEIVKYSAVLRFVCRALLSPRHFDLQKVSRNIMTNGRIVMLSGAWPFVAIAGRIYVRCPLVLRLGRLMFRFGFQPQRNFRNSDLRLKCFVILGCPGLHL